MELNVLRYNVGEDSTNGLLFIDEDFACFTLEDEARDVKVHGETCIPDGVYKIKLRTEGGFHERYKIRFKDTHKGMLHVCDVPGFSHILIHCGNTDEHTAGCLLVGDSQENNNIKKNGFVGSSKNAYLRIYKKISSHLEEGGEVTIEYTTIK
jgi:hypothetical protein